MTKIIGISGSLRKDSFNTALLRAAKQLISAKAALEVTTPEGIPLYNGDVETEEGIPHAVVMLQNKIAAADGILLATPEYNYSIPGVLKNTIDWLSRPPEAIPRVFGGRPVTVMGATPGGFGTAMSQNAWLPVLKRLGTCPWFGSQLMISRAQQVFDETGKLTDEAVRKRLEAFVAGFVRFIQSGNSR
ncbi:NAD(P)H-dependent FMN reductase [Nitrosomonas sp. Nm51]|uniref:NADPH-dependent FMN reductase n=1 Tax=Nitrosomonas sp. Nm51 TaxID=133720 RepID=UPI0008AC34CC|nr:NADPH-dependent FMN reductase [Nitrosomonas sp. Nm51]SER25769.1 NAD(P)H-dependent FMN reductase [Nitrosomonas sp. Nm51]